MKRNRAPVASVRIATSAFLGAMRLIVMRFEDPTAFSRTRQVWKLTTSHQAGSDERGGGSITGLAPDLPGAMLGYRVIDLRAKVRQERLQRKFIGLSDDADITPLLAPSSCREWRPDRLSLVVETDGVRPGMALYRVISSTLDNQYYDDARAATARAECRRTDGPLRAGRGPKRIVRSAAAGRPLPLRGIGRVSLCTDVRRAARCLRSVGQVDQVILYLLNELS